MELGGYAGITTPTFYRKAGPADSTPTAYPNGYRLGGLTNSGDPNSTPAFDASTPNTNNPSDASDQPTLHDRLLD